MKNVFVFSVLLTTFFVSCKKSENNAICTLSSTSIIGNYKITSIIETANGQSIDLFSDTTNYPLCLRDNIFSINSNGIFSDSEGATSCNPTSAIGTIGNWSLSGNNFTIVDNTFTDVYTISDYTCTSFKLNQSDSTGSFSITMTKQ